MVKIKNENDKVDDPSYGRVIDTGSFEKKEVPNGDVFELKNGAEYVVQLVPSVSLFMKWYEWFQERDRACENDLAKRKNEENDTTSFNWRIYVGMCAKYLGSCFLAYYYNILFSLTRNITVISHEENEITPKVTFCCCCND
jgi:hypothetical protein